MSLTATLSSSGNLLADRRYKWARAVRDQGDLAAAADLLQQTLELAPSYTSAWFALGEVRDQLGEREAALAAFRRAHETDPQDRHGAGLQLVRLGAQPASAMPEHYVRTLFDSYAAKFDRALTEGLNYRAPELLRRAVEGSGNRMKFGAALDLGCGTGLAGAEFRASTDWLAGVDLSPAMLAQARAKGVYDQLMESEILTFLAVKADIKARYHLVLAADVFVYFDDLAPALKAVAQVLDGILAFSVETHDGDNVMLRDTLRYAHGATHVRNALAAAGLKLSSLNPASTRTEKGVAVPGLVVVAER
jgi:predicted TPR repeat methyltransferase